MDIIIGEAPDDPVFTVTDLLPHLAGKLQGDKKISEVFDGEKLNLIAGSLPLGSESVKERFKLGILQLLHDKYGIIEEDFISAEIEAVPARAKCMDCGTLSDVEEFPALCPSCGGTRLNIEGGMELFVESLLLDE